MNGDGVSRKRVEYQHVKFLELTTAGFLFQREPSIALHYFDLSGTVAQIRKVGARSLRNVNHVGIDFVEAKIIAGPRQGSESPNPQADQSHSDRAWRMFAQQQIDPTVRAVVSGG